jgi:hypothetical protein
MTGRCSAGDDKSPVLRTRAIHRRLHEKELAIHLQGLSSEIMEVMGLKIDTFITRTTLSDPSLREHLFSNPWFIYLLWAPKDLVRSTLRNLIN